MKSYEIRKTFLDHFETYNHDLMRSSSLVPANDPTLLFNNAGMNQFKGIFLGQEPAPDSLRATSAQKCVRAGGKHNDLENVGFTARHHTFFEMMGNFSFGDYFKQEAIEMAWELLTQKFQLDEKRLYITVYNDDDEAAKLWHDITGISTDKIYRFGQKDNFWRMGDTGPCGPCSEIFYDQGKSVGGDPKENVMGGEGDRFIEIWNLVFMQYFEDENGKLNPLPKPSIDTGMGLERLSAIMQGQTNNYNTDLFLPLIEEASKISNVTYNMDALADDKNAAALRILADHARSLSFLMADGVIPSNEGRGYVLRRILRRAIRYGRTLSEKSILPEVCNKLIIIMNDFYPELEQSKDFILQTVRDEQERFLETLDKGNELLQNEIKKTQAKAAKTLSGDFVFKLYDTFGFPADLTQLIAKESGLFIDEESFDVKLKRAKETSKANRKTKSFNVSNSELQYLAEQIQDTKFMGYKTLSLESAKAQVFLQTKADKLKKCQELSIGEEAYIVFDQTPFYAEGGGQVADTGEGFTDSGQFEVLDVQKHKNIFVHSIKVTQGKIHIKEAFRLQVSSQRRAQIAAHHSATHLLHYALRQVLGSHVKQAGSLVNSDKLRFDFTNKGPLSPTQKQQIEDIVNATIKKEVTVQSSEKSYDEAIEDGAIALFGENYASNVRVIQMGESMELCGGTHVQQVSDIKYFKILSETSVSAGVRRIEALAGSKAINFLDQKFEDYKTVCHDLKLPEMTSAEQILTSIEAYKDEISNLKKKLKTVSQNSASVDDILAAQIHVLGHKLVVFQSDNEDRNALRELVDKIRDRIEDGVVVILGAESEKTPIIVGVTSPLNKKAPAGQILKAIAEKHNGRGGGRPDFAQGAVSQVTGIKETTETVLKSFNL